MSAQSIEVRDDAHWHELRKRHVGASEVACLLGLSKFKTKWRLYHEKRGTLEPDNLDDDRAVSTGKYMEPALATWAAEKFQWPLRKVHRYLSDPALKAGASLDYETVQGHEPVEVKFHMGFQSDDEDFQWDWEGDEITKAPVAYVIQVQYQLMLTGKPQGWLAAYVGQQPRRMLIPRSEPICVKLAETVREFWADVAAEKEPPVDWFADADGVAKLFQQTEDRTVELPDAETWVRKLKIAGRLEERGKKLRAEAKGNLWALADSASKAIVNGVTVDMGYTSPSKGTLITEGMVGTFLGGRDGFRRCQIRATGKRKGKTE